MSTDLPAPRFKHSEHVVVVGEEPRCSRWRGERGTVVWLDSSGVRRHPTQPEQWLYIVYLPAQASWRTFFQSDLASEGGLEPESAHVGSRAEISFDTVLEENNDWAEGSYRLPGEFWKVVIFQKADVQEVQCEPSRWQRPTKWEREITGVVIRFPRTARMSRDDLLRAMSDAFGWSEWAQVDGPDSMILR
jgi:hypothetical protein